MKSRNEAPTQSKESAKQMIFNLKILDPNHCHKMVEDLRSALFQH